MYLEEKINELEERIKKLEDKLASGALDTVIVKFQRERDLEAQEATKAPVRVTPAQVEHRAQTVKIRPRIIERTNERSNVIDDEEEYESDIEAEKEAVEDMLEQEAPQKKQIQTKHINKWVTAKQTPNEEVYEYNGHMLTLFDEGGNRFAQEDNKEPIRLNKKERKAFREVESIKERMEKRYMQ